MKLCNPAKIYLSLSVISIITLILQNISNSHSYCVGSYSVNLQHSNVLFFIMKLLYVGIWTYLLNNLCTSGYENISWFLILLPFLSFFLMIGMFLLINITN